MEKMLPFVLVGLISAGCGRESQLPQQTTEQATPSPSETPLYLEEKFTLQLQTRVNQETKQLCGDYIGGFSIFIGPWEGDSNGVYKIIISHEQCPTKMEETALNNLENTTQETLGVLLPIIKQHIQNQHPECLGIKGQIASNLLRKHKISPPRKPISSLPYFNKT